MLRATVDRIDEAVSKQYRHAESYETMMSAIFADDATLAGEAHLAQDARETYAALGDALSPLVGRLVDIRVDCFFRSGIIREFQRGYDARVDVLIYLPESDTVIRRTLEAVALNIWRLG